MAWIRSKFAPESSEERALFSISSWLLAFDLVDLGRQRIDGKLRCRLVDAVDGLVGHEAVGDAGPRGARRRPGVVEDTHAVVHLVALLQAAQDRDRRVHVGLVDHHRHEGAQGGVLLDVLAVLAEGRRADAAQVASGERGLEQVRRADGPLSPPAPRGCAARR